MNEQIIPMEIFQTKYYDKQGKPLTIPTKVTWYVLFRTLAGNAETGAFKPPTLEELAEITGLTKAGVRYIIKTLCELGFVKTRQFSKTDLIHYYFVKNPLEDLAVNI